MYVQYIAVYTIRTYIAIVSKNLPRRVPIYAPPLILNILYSVLYTEECRLYCTLCTV